MMQMTPLLVAMDEKSCRSQRTCTLNSAVADELIVTRIGLTLNKNAYCSIESIVEMVAFKLTRCLEAASGDYSWHSSDEFNKAVKDFHDRYALCTMQAAAATTSRFIGVATQDAEKN